jgi:type IV pilus assembly protein PilM
MDMKKEIKLSALIPKRKGATKDKAENAKAKPKGRSSSSKARELVKLSALIPKRKGATTDKAPNAKAKPKLRSSSSKARELVGLKIGASQIAAARVLNNGSAELLQVVREPLAPGIVVGGEVRDPAALGDALVGLFTRHQLPRKGVRLGLANSRIGVRVIEIAGIDDDKQLENAVGFRAHETLSVPLEEAVLDWRVLSRDVDETGVVTRRILLVVVYRESVDRYLAATDHAGIELASIDLEAFALLRAVSEPAVEGAERPEAAIVAITVGHERTTLAISDGRVCEFTRVLEWGGAEVTAAIARAAKISPLEAEELKHSVAFNQDDLDAVGDPRIEAALEAARFELQTLVRELLSSLRFYQSQPGSLAIGELLVSGGMAEMPGFAEELETQLGVRALLADPLARVKLGPAVGSLERPQSLAVVIGLGIED